MVWFLWFVVLGFLRGRGNLLLRIISGQTILNAYLLLRN